MSDWVIEASELTKTYQLGSIEVKALCGVSFKIRRGKYSIMGWVGNSTDDF